MCKRVKNAVVYVIPACPPCITVVRGLEQPPVKIVERNQRHKHASPVRQLKLFAPIIAFSIDLSRFLCEGTRPIAGM